MLKKRKRETEIHYLYRHIRLDNFEVFYIGRGKVKETAKTERGRYERAYERDGESRSIFWKKIEAKAGREIEILYEGDYTLICRKEREFIKMYGRRDLGLGTLCNLTDGGETEKGAYRSVETKLKLSVAKIGKMRGGESPHAITVFAYTLDGAFYKEYPSMADCSIDLNIKQRAISCIVGKNKPENFHQKGQRAANGFTFFADFRGDFTEIPPKRKHGQGFPVAIINEAGDVIQTFASMRSAERETGDWRSCINYSVFNGTKTLRGNIFKILK